MDEPTVKQCATCGETKPTDAFYRNCHQCKDCKRAANRRWNAAHKDVIDEAARRWREANPEAALANSRKASLRFHGANREAVFNRYGRSCACCGATARLSVDHVNGDGREHRAEIGMGSSHLYRWLIANGFPDGFQVLCKLCNKSKADGDRCRLNHPAT